jgi:hypothetical protein
VDWASLLDSRNRGTTAIKACSEHVPIRSQTVDILTCTVVVPYTDETRTIREIGRVLKEGATAYLCLVGAGYYVRYLLKASAWKMRFYGLRTLINTWFYVLSGRRLPRFLGDTLYQSRARLLKYYRQCGLSLVREQTSPTYAGRPVLLFHVVQKAAH